MPNLVRNYASNGGLPSPFPRRRRPEGRNDPLTHSVDQGAIPNLVRSKPELNVTSANESSCAADQAFAKTPLPEGFKRRSGGIWFTPGNDTSSKIRVCGNLDFVAKTRDANNASWGVLLEWKDGDGRTHRWAMPMSMLAGDGGEIRSTLLDQGLFVAATKQARTKFMELLSTVEVDRRARAVTTVGWADGAFVLPASTIGDTSENLVIFQNEAAFDHAYWSLGDLAQWQKDVAGLATGNSRLILAISAAFVGPLLAPLGEEGGGLNFRGASSIGKSTALSAGASVWGAPAFVRQWRATSNGLEGVCVQHNETLLCLDELGQLEPSEAGSVAYMIANGMGKARASRSGALRSPAKWRVMFLSSGEIGLGEIAARDARRGNKSAAGQEVRILDVEADARAGLGLFETLHDAPSAEALARRIKEGTARAYGFAGPEFVARLIADRDAHVDCVKRDIDAFVAANVPAGANGQVARAARRFALIAAAGELAVKLGVLPWTPGEANQASAMIFKQWLNERGGAGAAEDREAISRVRGFLEKHGSSRFDSMDDCDDVTRIINRVGFWRDTLGGREFLILPEMWKVEVCAGMDANRVARVLAQHGFLTKDSAGKNSISVNLPAGLGKTRCYCVNASIFESES